MTLADMLSIPSEIEHEYEGEVKKYTIGKPGTLEMGKFQRYLEVRAREAVERGSFDSEEARDRANNLVTRDIVAGVYEWEGPACIEALQHPAGIQKYLEILLNIGPREAKSLVDARLKLLVELVKCVRDDDPKGAAAVLARLGLPADFLKPAKASSSGSGRRARSRKQKSSR